MCRTVPCDTERSETVTWITSHGPSFCRRKLFPSFDLRILLLGNERTRGKVIISLAIISKMTTTSLRAVTHRLTTTPVQQLPPIASFLATSLSDCGELLSAPQSQKAGKTESDDALQIHKLKTRLASLLQDKSVEGRWTAVVLMKATVEAGQWEVLRGCEPLVRSLIGILAVGLDICWLRL